MNDVTNALPRNEGEPYTFQAWPSYCVGPDGAGQNFASEAEVPDGWTMPGGKVKGAKAKPAAAPANTTVAGSESGTATVSTATTPAANPVVSPADGSGPSEGSETDSAGVPWSPELHAATKGKTKAGLWRMKVGVARPDGQGEPKTLDL